MKHCKILFTALLLLLLPLQTLMAAGISTVVNVRYEWRDSRLAVTYDLLTDAVIDLKMKCMVNGKTITRYLYIHQKINDDHLTGDVGSVTAGMGKYIEWDGTYSDVDFIEDVQLILHSGECPVKTSIIGSFGYSFSPEQYSGGLLVALTASNLGVGGFIHFRSNYNFGVNYSYVCDASGNIDGYQPFYSGNSQKLFYMFNVGAIYNFLNARSDKSALILGIGVGYGVRDLYWQMLNGAWALNTAARNDGVSAELNLIGSYKGFSLMAGVGTLNFRYVDLQVGIGVTF